MRIRDLTPEQLARIPEIVDKWTRIGLSIEPVDRERAERALCRLYASVGLVAPRILWVPCPLSGMLSAFLYAARRGPGSGPVDRSTRSRAALCDRAINTALGAIVLPAMQRPLRLAVDEAIDRALRPGASRGSGCEATLAITQAQRLGGRLNKWLYGRIEKRLCELIIEPIRATVGASLGGFLEQALNRIGQGLVGPQPRLAGWAYFGAPLWVAFAAQMDYLTRVLGLPLDRSFVETVEYCGLYWTFDDLCFAAERPLFLNRDEGGNLHCEVGPALAYPSGWCSWHWHGIAVPQHLVEAPQRITIAAIEAEKSSPLRRVMIERYREGHAIHGVAAFLRDAGGIRLDHDEAFGTLWQCAMPEDEPLVMVEVVNHSPEPDGSYKRYFLRVHPELRPLFPDGTLGMPQEMTARNAVASTFGLRGLDYAPDVET